MRILKNWAKNWISWARKNLSPYLDVWLDNPDRMFYLPYWVEEDEDEVHEIAEPQERAVHVERVVHVAVDKSGRVDKRDEGEFLLFRRRNLRLKVVDEA